MASIFTRIIRGEIPCHKILDNELVIAFLDVNPLSTGHALVVPKEEKAFLHELSPESARALGEAISRVAAAVMRATGAADYNVLQNNGARAHQEVPHVHFHVIPKYKDGSGLGISWPAKPVHHPEAALLAARMAKSLGD
ncbi:MAG: HIT family protein [Planctomycetes bacterium]|nr:HIT family protein [Planctomycetota bacterium]